MNKEFVSVIVTTKNEEENIERLLKSIITQTYKYIEIIVVDNKSTDKTTKFAKIFTKKVYDFGPERSAQRNFGARKSYGKYLLFLDADMKLTKNVICECVELLNNNKQMGCVVIPEVSVANNYWENVKAFEREFYMENGDQFVEAARFFSKTVFEKLGGYDEKITGPEDWDLPERAKEEGIKVGRVKAKIYHFERISGPFKLAKKKYYYGLKSYVYMEKRGLSLVSPKTIYFLRPVFYKEWKKMLQHPLLSLGMFFMLFVEQIGGGLGYLVGRFKKKVI